MNHVDHIPQTLASHGPVPAETRTHSQHGADMLQPDPRDTFYNSEPLSFSSDPLSTQFIWFFCLSISVALEFMSTEIVFLLFVFCICILHDT